MAKTTQLNQISITDPEGNRFNIDFAGNRESIQIEPGYVLDIFNANAPIVPKFEGDNAIFELSSGDTLEVLAFKSTQSSSCPANIVFHALSRQDFQTNELIKQQLEGSLGLTRTAEETLYVEQGFDSESTQRFYVNRTNLLEIDSLIDYEPDDLFDLELPPLEIVGDSLSAAEPVITIGNANGFEGEEIIFRVFLDQPSSSTISVDYTAVDISGIKGIDYDVNDGQLDFTPGMTEHFILVQLFEDSDAEIDEFFAIELSNAISATLAGDPGLGTILNLDAPLVSIDDATGGEATEVFFRVALDRSSTLPITVDFATNDLTATGGVDYMTSMGTLTFMPGQTELFLPVAHFDDQDTEPEEFYEIALSNPMNTMLGDALGLGTITNDEDIPLISLADSSAPETAGSIPFNIQLDRAATVPIGVSVSTFDGTATAPEDYAPQELLFVLPPGAISQPFQVPIFQDSVPEGNQNFFVEIAALDLGKIPDPIAMGIIIDELI